VPIQSAILYVPVYCCYLDGNIFLLINIKAGMTPIIEISGMYIPYHALIFIRLNMRNKRPNVIA
jgi:hypothetical protein